MTVMGGIDRGALIQAEALMQERAARHAAADEASEAARAEAAVVDAARPKDVGSGPGRMNTPEVVNAIVRARVAVDALRTAVDQAPPASLQAYLGEPLPGSIGALYDDAGRQLAAVELLLAGAVQPHPSGVQVKAVEGYLLQSSRLARLVAGAAPRHSEVGPGGGIPTKFELP